MRGDASGSMDHAYIDAEDVAGRYLTGTLPADERQRFEEHFVECPRCLDTLEHLDGMQRALRSVAAEDAARTPSTGVARSRWRPILMWPVGIAATIAVISGGAEWVRERRELARVSHSAADLSRRYDEAQAANRELSARVQQLERLRAQPGVAAPPASMPVFALTTVRGAGGAAPPNRVTLSGTAPWIVLALDIDVPDAAARYRAVLKDARGRERWRQDDLVASTPETLGIALPSTLLANEPYTLEIARRRSGSDAWTPAGRYAFQAVRSR